MATRRAVNIRRLLMFTKVCACVRLAPVHQMSREVRVDREQI
jgi:hypothetical protein